MIISEFDKAHILSRALPYIQQYNGKTIVVKYGGNAMIDEELKSAVMNDIALLSLIGIHVGSRRRPRNYRNAWQIRN